MRTPYLLMLGSVCLSLPAADPVCAEPPQLPEEKFQDVVNCPSAGSRVVFSLSADGRRLLTFDNDAARLWDVETGQEIASFGPPQLTAGDKSFYLRLWDKHGRLGSECPQGVLSPDGRRIAACYDRDLQTVVYLYDASTHELVRRLDHGEEPVVGLAFSPDGKTLVSSTDRVVRLWDVAEGEEELQLNVLLPDEANGIDMVAFAPDGKSVAAALGHGIVVVCDPKTGETLHRLPWPDDEGTETHVAYSPDGKYLAVARCGNHIVQIWDAAAGQFVRTMDMGDEVGAPLFSADGKTLVVPCRTGTQLLEVATGRERHHLDSDAIGALALNRADHWLTGARLGARAGIYSIWLWGPDADPPGHLSAKELDELWQDLASPDAALAYRAVVALSLSHHGVAEALTKRLVPDQPATAAELDRLIANLQDDDFAEREQASGRLAALGGVARSRIMRALAEKPSAELKWRAERLLDAPPGPEELRRLRAVEVLEYIGSEEARKGLRKLADGPEGALAAEDARAALKRLGRK